MKISNHIIKNYTEPPLHAKEGSISHAAGSGGHNFDAVIIQSNPREIEEHHFAKVLAERLSSEIKNSAAPEKIHDLKSQISGNAYTVDVHAIASKILLV